jgi:hypothetical protein
MRLAVTIQFSALDNIKGELAKGNPIVFGMALREDFDNLRGDHVYMSNGSTSHANHAMVVVGYDETRQAFKIINSWGRGWGAKGFAWISYEEFSRDAKEAYVMKVKAALPEPPPPMPDPKPEPVPIPTLDFSQLACARVTVDLSVKPIVRGFVSTDEDLGRVEKAFKDQNADIKVDVRPWPQCEMLLTLDKELAAPHRPAIGPIDSGAILKSGDTLSFKVTAPDQPAFMYASYIEADGSVVTLLQPALVPPTPSDPTVSQLFGDGKDGRDQFTIGPPYGREMIVVVASRSPLFDAPLPAIMTEREYLSQLRKAFLYKPDANLPDREVAAAFLPIETREK